MSAMNGVERGCSRIICAETGETYKITPTGTGYFSCPGCDRSHKV